MKRDNIWKKWEDHYSNLGIESDRICRDGIINQEIFSDISPKVLFVMREANKWPGGDIRKLLQDGPKYQMWHTVARWSAGLIRNFPPYDKINDKKSKRKSIRSIASINLKKITGGSKADHTVINSFAFNDRELLLEQINFISPDIIIAGGTFDSLIWLLELNVDPLKPYSKPIFDKNRNIKVVPWQHPARVNNRKTYSELRALVLTA